MHMGFHSGLKVSNGELTLDSLLIDKEHSCVHA